MKGKKDFKEKKGNKKTQPKEITKKYKKGDELNVFELSNDKEDSSRRSNLTTKLDKDEDYDQRGLDNDSDDDKLRDIKIDHLKDTVVNDSDDEEIDSDDAFEGSDDEKYADWHFTGSKHPNRLDDGVDGVDGVDEDDEDDEEMVDLDTMLNDDNQLDQDITKEDVDDSDVEFEQDEQGDSTKLTQLVDSLDPSSKKSTTNDSPTSKDGFVAGKNSEFRVPTDG